MLIIHKAVVASDFASLAMQFADKIGARVVDSSDSGNSTDTIKIEYSGVPLLLRYAEEESHIELTAEFAGNQCVLIDLEELLNL